MSCHVCGSSLGCAVNCSMAPWNWDANDDVLPDTTPIAHLKRLVRWCRRDGRSYRNFGPLGFTLSQLRWL